MNSNRTNSLLSIALVALAVFVIVQEQRARKLQADCKALQEQLAKANASNQADQKTLAALRKQSEIAQTERSELMRLRAQASHMRELERDNAALRADRGRLPAASPTEQIHPALESSEQTKKTLSNQPDPAPRPTKDLGILELSDRTPTLLQLAEGKECVLTATILPDGNLHARFASISEVDGIPVQSEHSLTVTPGQTSASVINGVEITFTLVLKGN